MFSESHKQHLSEELKLLRTSGLYKQERIISSPQDAVITLTDGRKVINFCANNYLGLASHPILRQCAKDAIDLYGCGMASVRFICGTQHAHTVLEKKLSNFLGTDDTILYSSCFDANGGLFETILSETDAVISDALNHASIIDGIRLCKAARFRYKNNDMQDLEEKLKEAESAKIKLIATDGVFSMDGVIADLRSICDLAEKYQALVMVDDSHAAGFMGRHGRGTPEYCGVEGRVDIITGTFGKALGGMAGGYTSGRKEIISWLRQRSRPYLFSNSIPPLIAHTTVKALNIISESPSLIEKIHTNSAYFRKKMSKAGFTLAGKDHPIVPVMIGDAVKAVKTADILLEEGIYAIGFCFPVVPKDAARIRIQLSAAHTTEQIDTAVDAFIKAGRHTGII